MTLSLSHVWLFYANGGLQTLLEMSNFNFSKCDCLWTFCCSSRSKIAAWLRKENRSCTKRLTLYHPLCPESWTHWDLMGEIFERKGPTLQRLFSCAVETWSPILYNEFINNAYVKLTMANLVRKGAQFKHFSYALYATDVIFLQGNCPTGTMLEGKHNFSGKHKLYAYKTEVSVAPTGLTIHAIDHKPGSISDLVIFQGNLQFHQ